MQLPAVLQKGTMAARKLNAEVVQEPQTLACGTCNASVSSGPVWIRGGPVGTQVKRGVLRKHWECLRCARCRGGVPIPIPGGD